MHLLIKTSTMHLLKKTAGILCLLMVCAGIPAQDEASLAEKLGYPHGSKLLIVHADDLGLSHAANKAGITAFKQGGISSASVMVPCPWFEEIAHYLKEHPEYDVGIHLTLTAEWKHYRWDGVVSSGEIPSLLNRDGYFYSSVQEVAVFASTDEVEKELRAQIDRAIAYGINPSHIDTHMGAVAARPDILQVYFKLGREYRIPLFIPRPMVSTLPGEQRAVIESEFILLDNYFMLTADTGVSWEEAYEEILGRVEPGLNQLIIHPAYDTGEMQSITYGHPAFGAQWRQKDLDYVLSENFRNSLRKHDIHLVSWTEIKNLMNQPQ